MCVYIYIYIPTSVSLSLLLKGKEEGDACTPPLGAKPSPASAVQRLSSAPCAPYRREDFQFACNVKKCLPPLKEVNNKKDIQELGLFTASLVDREGITPPQTTLYKEVDVGAFLPACFDVFSPHAFECSTRTTLSCQAS